jgi:hypothetical protein
MTFDREVSLSEEIVEMSENGFCHHCKQLRTTYVMASCKYNSSMHGLLLPISTTIGGVQLPNVEPRQT